MTDHEKRIREALEVGPTEGPFRVIQAESAAYSYDVMTEDGYYVATAHGLVRGEDKTGEVTAAFFAACNPAAIRALLADLDAARAALQSQPAAEVSSDDDIYALWAKHCQTPGTTTRQLVCAFARALRPQAESDARRAAQEQLYTERERHTAEVKRLQAEIGRLQSLRPQAVPMTEGWQEVAACPDGDVWFSLSCGHVVMGWKQGPLLLDWEAAVDHDCCSDASAIKAMPVTPPAHHGITAPAGGEGQA